MYNDTFYNHFAVTIPQTKKLITMKFLHLITVLSLTLIFAACSNPKLSKAEDQLTDATWELDYISGPRIAFAGLYPDKKPTIAFNIKEKQVSGNNGCNGYSAKYSAEGDAISFGEPGPTTMMFCQGGGDQVFLKTMSTVNKFNFDDEGKLQLLLSDVSMMRFKKIK